MLQGTPFATTTSDGFRHCAEVRFHELDSSGLVFPMWYLAYFDDAMIGYFRSRGVSHKSVSIQVVRSELELREAPLHRGDRLDIKARPTAIGAAGFSFEFTALLEGTGKVIAVGKISYACMASEPDCVIARQSIPATMLDALQADFLVDFDSSG
jgi:acyl-CoA thioester hydrolase